MNEITETVENLLRLQVLETEMARVDAGLSRVPTRIAEIERTLEGAEKALAAAKARQQDGGKERRSLEQEIEAVKVTISRHQDQLMQVKTNEQYRAMNKEIAAERAKIEDFEEKILINLERQDDLVKAAKAKESDLARERERVAAEKASLLEERKRLEVEKGAIGDEHVQVCCKLPADALALFRRVVQMRGSAVARVTGNTCGDCRVRARPQALAEARLRDRLIQCENCHRIFYTDPLPSATSGETAAAIEGP